VRGLVNRLKKGIPNEKMANLICTLHIAMVGRYFMHFRDFYDHLKTTGMFHVIDENMKRPTPQFLFSFERIIILFLKKNGGGGRGPDPPSLETEITEFLVYRLNLSKAQGIHSIMEFQIFKDIAMLLVKLMSKIQRKQVVTLYYTRPPVH
jgi:hypothetical protein